MDDILREIPFSFDTRRLTIRAPHPGDGRLLNEAVKESSDRLRPWFPWALENPTPEESEAFIRRKHINYLSRSELMMLLLLKETETLIGCSGLHRIDWSIPRFEIGYWVRSGYEGKGLITEAVCGIANLAFESLGARRVDIRCDADNKRSQAVALRAGFEKEGTLRCYDRHHETDQLRDMMFFSRIKRDDS